MEQLIDIISKNGIGVVVVGVFLWQYIAQNKSNVALLAELSRNSVAQTVAMESIKSSSQSVSVAVEVIKDLVTDEMNKQKEHYMQVDYINKDVKVTAEVCKEIQARLSRK